MNQYLCLHDIGSYICLVLMQFPFSSQHYWSSNHFTVIPCLVQLKMVKMEKRNQNNFLSSMLLNYVAYRITLHSEYTVFHIKLTQEILLF